MRFCISLFQHTGGRPTLHDYTIIFADGLRALGHEVTIEPDRMDLDAINLLFEFNPPAINKAIFDSGAKYALICTEFAAPGTDGRIVLNQRTDSDWPERASGFLEAVKRAEWCWTLWPDQAPFYRQFTRAEYLELGYSEALAAEYASTTEPDLDACFSGVMTPHRLAILDALQQRGLVVGNKPGLVSVAERNAMMARSKLILCLKQHPMWALGSASRVAGALHVGRLPCQESVAVASRPCSFAAEPDQGQPYVDWIMERRDRSWRLSAELRQTEYKEQMPVKLTMERALDGVMAK